MAACGRSLVDFGVEQRVVDLDAPVSEPLRQVGPEAGGLYLPQRAAHTVRAHPVVKHKYVLEEDHIGLHVPHLGDLGYPPGAILQPGEVHDNVQSRRQLFANGPHGKVEPGHQRHGLDAREGVARTVRVDGRERALVTGVHGLEHVQRFA